MPITSSAKKALRQNRRRRTRNLLSKGVYKKEIKRYRRLLEGQKMDEAGKFLSVVYKALDKAAKNKVIERNKASRLKSRLSQLISAKK